uniref:Eukaryotic translation initiation factor 4E binding protein 2 n=5 Tax=Neoaves TaxID=3078114 RepID=A0A8D0F515_STROC
MSSAGGRQPSQSRAIPTRTVALSDAAQLPPDYCTTPGGTLFSTTPGGTRIIYDRKFLLDRRNSPMAQTPPCHLPNIPGVTSPGSASEEPKADTNSLNHQEGKPSMGKKPPGVGWGDLGWRVTPLTLLSLPLARGRRSVRDGYLSGNHGEAATPQTCAHPNRLSRIRPGEVEAAAVPAGGPLPAPFSPSFWGVQLWLHPLCG